MPYYTCLWGYFLLVTWCCGSRSPISSWGLRRGWDCTNTHLLLKDTASGQAFHFSSLSASPAHTHTLLSPFLTFQSPPRSFPPRVPADGSKSGAASGTKPVGPHRAQSLPESCEHLLIRRVSWKWENICLPLQIHPDSLPLLSSLVSPALITQSCGDRAERRTLIHGWHLKSSSSLWETSVLWKPLLLFAVTH